MQLVKGKWSKGDDSSEGQEFRQKVSADGSTQFAVEAGRYHLYFSYSSPFAHRALVMRRLKGLEGAISASSVGCYREEGWEFGEEQLEGVDARDPLFGFRHLHQVYTKAVPDFTGRVTVPVLWDKKRNTIVSNNSGEIMRMFDQEFGALASPTARSYCPPEHRASIDKLAAETNDKVDLGVYRAGCAREQAAYESAVRALFETLDKLEAVVGRQRFLVGDQVTEADLRLFATLVRFDAIYLNLFKCNVRAISQYEGLSRWLREMYSFRDGDRGVKETVKIGLAKCLHFQGMRHINPSGIVPLGPSLDYFMEEK
jgi:glutathionyl-hydroquinone reductase